MQHMVHMVVVNSKHVRCNQNVFCVYVHHKTTREY